MQNHSFESDFDLHEMKLHAELQPASRLSIWVSFEIYFGREPREVWGGGELIVSHKSYVRPKYRELARRLASRTHFHMKGFTLRIV